MCTLLGPVFFFFFDVEVFTEGGACEGVGEDGYVGVRGFWDDVRGGVVGARGVVAGGLDAEDATADELPAAGAEEEYGEMLNTVKRLNSIERTCAYEDNCTLC